ncbi:MAG: REP-associated tyrosine transposase, partial [Longimicrobiales bacterium]
MQYRRASVSGTSYFFTVVTYNRRPLFAEAHAVALLRAAIKRVQEKRPFGVDAEVILPDHLHAIWTLPDGDCDYPTRWRLIKEGFTRAYTAAI